MFSDLFYLSSLLDISLAFNKKEKQEIFDRSRVDHSFCLKSIVTLEDEIHTLDQYGKKRRVQIGKLNQKTQKKIELIEEITYADSMKNRFQYIKELEYKDKD